VAYIVRGRIGSSLGNAGRLGQFTYLAETADHFYIWGGAHKASRFDSAEAGLLAAERCNGPWFNVPDAASVESVESPADEKSKFDT
jgi:hypothetical protein